MKIGSMRHRITIQRYAATDDDAGGSTLAWSNVSDIYAKIQPSKVQESLFSEQMREVTSHLITIRYRADLTHKDRLFHSVTRNGTTFTRTFAIKGIKDVENQHRFIQIAAEEGVPT